MYEDKKAKNVKKLALNLKTNNSRVTQNMQPEEIIHLYKQGPARILHNLYLGAYNNALNTIQLEQLNITCIINVADEININTSLEYHHIRWTHGQKDLASTEFSKAIALIEKAHTRGQKILVHCQQGIERSAALVVAYILYLSHQKSARRQEIKGQHFTVEEAISYVRERSAGIRPNMELLYQLQEYKNTLAPSLKKHNIQNRTRRSESITYSPCKTITSIKSLHCRPRSASFKETSLSSLTQPKNVKLLLETN